MSGSAPLKLRVAGLPHVNVFALSRKMEFGDVLLVFYAAAFLRQYLWPVGNQFVAWSLTAALSMLLGFIHLRTKPEVGERTPRVFWVVVLLPLLFVYVLRAPFPDLSFDVLNQRLLQGERALRGPQFLPGDFFPTILPLNPSSDMLTGIFRHILGYRLGTIINLLALVWAGTIIDKLLRPFVKRDLLRSACVLLVLFTEHILFEANNYMVDLLALPLELEALRLALNYGESDRKHRDLLFAALLLGASVGLKLTNVVVALPVAVIFAVRVFSARIDGRTLGYVAVACLIFFLPILPHAFYIWRETGSPVFPLYNSLIRSSLWSNVSPYDGRWGPRDTRETLLWPLMSAWRPGRLSELGLYSGRLTIGFVATVLGLLLPQIGKRTRLIALAVLLGSLMWSVTSGYVRYALFVEIADGVLVFALARYVWDRTRNFPRPLKFVVVALPICLLSLQCILAATLVRQTEWGGRPTVFDDAAGYGRELRWVGRDRDLLAFQPDEYKGLIRQVDAWVVSGVKSNGIEALLRPDAPALGIAYDEYFEKPDARRRFADAVEFVRGKRVYSLTLHDELDASLQALRRRGLTTGQVTPVLVCFFSAHRRVHMLLIEVFPPEKRETPRRGPMTPDVTEAKGPLEGDAFQAIIKVPAPPMRLRAGQKETIQVIVKNASDYVWSARGQSDGKFFLNAGDIWLEATGNKIVNSLDGRTTIPRDLYPGEETTLPLQITAPATPGEYVLEIDVVQEGVGWFKDRGSTPLRIRVQVE